MSSASRRWAATKTITVDVRVIASTNKDLEEEISRGNFREDLFYRLNVIPFFVPPLRERKEDIPLFARHFLKELAATYWTPAARDHRRRHRSPDALFLAGQRARIAQRDRAHRDHESHDHALRPQASAAAGLPRRQPARGKTEFSTLHQARDAYERDYILKKLDENHGNVSRTAEVLGLERSHLYRKMKTLGIAAKE